MAEEIDEHHLLVVAGSEAPDLLEDVRTQGPPEILVKPLMDEIQNFAKSKPAVLRQVREEASALPELPSSIQIQAFGDPEVRINNVILKTADWQSPQQLEMFLYILMKPQGVTRKTLEDVFSFKQWKSGSQFTNAMYRLRNVIGNGMFLLEQNHYAFNRNLDYSCDFEQFQVWADRAKILHRSGKNSVLPSNGCVIPWSLFSNAERSWIHEERERFALAYLKAALSIAQHHYDREEYPLALDYCLRILDKDECQEEAHRLAMRAYSRMGNRSGVEKQYRWCAQALQVNYSTEPSEKTKLLYRELNG